jgi:hypothetical protein
VQAFHDGTPGGDDGSIVIPKPGQVKPIGRPRPGVLPWPLQGGTICARSLAGRHICRAFLDRPINENLMLRNQAAVSWHNARFYIE